MLLKHSSVLYLDDLLNIDYFYFEQMVSEIYPTEIQLKNCLDFELPITNDIVSSKHYHKQDDCYFELIIIIVNFPFLHGDAPRSPSNSVYISQFILFSKVFSNVNSFNNRK